ncbi:uncharacterized protein MYCFIDRAFT_77479 [Pseudocercospora fijiensis CIRAD86]|uniref:Metallo-beta-lactamase domain-containing protein n=1 Tax=Pseudocercospora fijiensis (strain CIRAD86) TaxID=383855 RepID=M3BBX6_PSEFD|nr:uncharacterized protein MYCFIDRAFT_77479 [Pseudocercospora fijiensis CIRAD86]EME86693.1 hypothetical protein MYCFIDRAFT_77479 [Pseudocercospora fijiensis CIRAD86]
MSKAKSNVVIRDISSQITTFTAPFYRFAPFGYRKFVAVGNRATAIRLQDRRVLLLNPIQLGQAVQDRLDQLGGVDYIACDLGHHSYVADYLNRWPNAKTIGVSGLPGKRKDVKWDFIYEDWQQSPEDQFSFSHGIETVLFEGFITHAVAWYHRPTKTLIISDLLMNLPATEQYHPSSADEGPFSREFAKRAHPFSIWFRRLIYYVAYVEYTPMRRDAKRVAELDIQRIVPCHGDVLDSDGNKAWAEGYQWFLEGHPQPGWLWAVKEPIMTVVRRLFLM